MGGCLAVEMDPLDPLFSRSTDEPYPHEGTLRISAANGAFVEIVALDGLAGDIAVTWDVDGDGPAAAEGPHLTTWACLEAKPDSSECFP